MTNGLAAKISQRGLGRSSQEVGVLSSHGHSGYAWPSFPGQVSRIYDFSNATRLIKLDAIGSHEHGYCTVLASGYLGSLVEFGAIADWQVRTWTAIRTFSDVRTSHWLHASRQAYTGVLESPLDCRDGQRARLASPLKDICMHDLIHAAWLRGSIRLPRIPLWVVARATHRRVQAVGLRVSLYQSRHWIS